MRVRTRAPTLKRPGYYFSPPLPRILAHRGLALDVPENTIAAFARAIDAGVQYIETDVRASKDSVAMIVHDDSLDRVAGIPDRVRDLSASELRSIDLGAGHVMPTLAEALAAFPDTRFNIDVKAIEAVAPIVRAVRDAGAEERVLITSFSSRSRSATVRGLPGVASSASPARFALILALSKLGLLSALPAAYRGLDAIQAPQKASLWRVVTPRVIDAVHRAGLEIHIWTVNSPAEMTRLVKLGVDGIVTDRADLARETLDDGGR